MKTKKKILLIEDNEQNRYLATFLLEGHGHTVVSAPDGPGGIRLALEDRFDLVLLDIQLPEMDGYSVAASLRKNRITGTVPIIAVTSYAMPGDREKAVNAGCNGYIEKPINPDTFVSEIESFFGTVNGEEHE